MLQSYAGQPVRGYSLDIWNGTLAQCQNFIAQTGITHPLLRNAGTAGIGHTYATAQAVSFVIDGDGIIVYRASGFDQTAVEAAIDQAVDDLSTGVDDAPAARSFVLNPAKPNPFNPATVISWNQAPDTGSSRVRVEILDLLGRRVARLLDATLSGGDHAVTWRGTDDAGRRVESGLYIAMLEVGGERQSRFLTLVK